MAKLRHKLKPGTVVEVTWWDTESDPSWRDVAAIDKIEPPLCRTVGYYHGCRREKGKVKWIILNHSVHNSQADYTIIPYGCVKKIERI